MIIYVICVSVASVIAVTSVTDMGNSGAERSVLTPPSGGYHPARLGQCGLEAGTAVPVERERAG